MDPTTPSRQPLTINVIGRKGLEVFRARKAVTLRIIALVMILPQILFTLYVDIRGVGLSDQLQRAISNMEAASEGTHDFFPLLEIGSAFVTPFLAGIVALWLTFMLAYFGLIQLSVAYFRGEELTFGQALKRGAQSTLRRGITLTLLLIGVGMLGQLLVAVALVVAIMGLIIPVIVVTDGKGSVAAFFDALTIRYAQGSQYSGWSVMFALITIGAFFYAGVLSFAVVAEFGLRLDEWIGFGRGLFAETIGASAISVPYLLFSLLETAGIMGIVGLVPLATVSLYFTVVGNRPISVA